LPRQKEHINMADNIVATRKTPASETLRAVYMKPGAGSLRTCPFFINNTGHALQVLAITERHITKEATAGTLTATIWRAPSATALASGTALHATGIDLKGGANNTNQSPTLSATAADTIVADGDALGFVPSAAGTEIADVCVTVLMAPLP
jgi:hypothetical protein